MTDEFPDLCLETCRHRQQRLCQIMQQHDIERAIITSQENIQYLTAFRPHRLLVSAICLDAAGCCTMAAPNEVPARAAVDDVTTFDAQYLCTLRQEQPGVALERLHSAIGETSGRVGIEFTAATVNALRFTGGALSKLFDLDPHLWHLRRRKDADELAMLRKSIACTDAMYARAREIIEPGVNELYVYEQLHAGAVDVAGEPLTAMGNDYQCGTPGGAPRNRQAEAGELYILDLGPAYRGYNADNCRTFSVDGKPTDQQLHAWQVIISVFEMMEAAMHPGASCSELFLRASDIFAACDHGEFFHHLGHGIGLYPHEAPHFNPNWNDTLQEGDCVTVEPGLYSESLRGGIRLEQDYLITSDGVERLTSFPLEL
ncbi:MAG: aminopeptidase P family protein [Planctomycetales bacterium]|nr:aminopeptidase P family protein [Planctomycetales bacterium]